MSEIDDIAKAISGLSERIRRLEAQEVALTAGAPLSHAMVGAQHTYAGGAALDVFGLSAPNTIAKLTPSSAPGAASAILKSDAAGGVDLAGGIVGGAATGGDQGAGTVNLASHYYVNGVVIDHPAMHTSLWLAGFEQTDTDGFLSDFYTSGIEANCTIIQIVWTYYIAVANDANNYWTITLRRDDTGAVLATWDTSGDTFNTKYRVVTAYNIALTTAMNGIYIRYDKDGAGSAPGTIEMFPPIIQVKPT
jgi:hypothetical protein